MVLIFETYIRTTWWTYENRLLGCATGISHSTGLGQTGIFVYDKLPDDAEDAGQESHFESHFPLPLGPSLHFCEDTVP